MVAGSRCSSAACGLYLVVAMVGEVDEQLGWDDAAQAVVADVGDDRGREDIAAGGGDEGGHFPFGGLAGGLGVPKP